MPRDPPTRPQLRAKMPAGAERTFLEVGPVWVVEYENDAAWLEQRVRGTTLLPVAHRPEPWFSLHTSEVEVFAAMVAVCSVSVLIVGILNGLGLSRKVVFGAVACVLGVGVISMWVSAYAWGRWQGGWVWIPFLWIGVGQFLAAGVGLAATEWLGRRFRCRRELEQMIAMDSASHGG